MWKSFMKEAFPNGVKGNKSLMIFLAVVAVLLVISWLG